MPAAVAEETVLPPAVERPPRRLPAWSGAAGLGLYAVVAWVYLLAFPQGLPLPELDQSWAGVVTRASAAHWEFGRQIMSNHGPWSHFGTGFYYAPLFTENYLFQLVSKAVLVALICRVGLALPPLARGLFLASNLLVGIVEWEYIHTLAVVYAGWLACEDRTRTGRLIGGAGVLLAAAAALMKTFYLLFGQGVFVCVLARHVLRGRGARSAQWHGLWPLALFNIGFCLNWFLAGQSLANLPVYLRGTFALTDGHSRAMGLDPSPVVFCLAVVPALWMAGLGFVWFRRGPRATMLAAMPLAALFAGSLFMAWKQGITRADRFHLSGYFCFLAVFATTLPLFFDRRVLAPIWHRASIAGVWILAFTAIVLVRPAQGSLLARELVFRPAYNLRVLFDPATERARMDALVDTVRRENALPRTRAAVGDARIDFFGTWQNLVWLNGLNYAPVPTVQGFLAATPYLSELNLRCYAPDRAPEFVLYKSDTIDDRWDPLDGALQLREILWNYQPVLIEDQCLLLRRKPASACAPPRPVLQQQGEVALDTPLPLPADGADWCELEVHRTLLSRLVNFFYHEPPLLMQVTTLDGVKTLYTLPPVMAQGGFLLRQPPLTSEDLGRLLGGKSVKNPVTSICLGGDTMLRATVGETVSYRFYGLDPIRPLRN